MRTQSLAAAASSDLGLDASAVTDSVSGLGFSATAYVCLAVQSC